jgi:hypothetical protein
MGGTLNCHAQVIPVLTEPLTGPHYKDLWPWNNLRIYNLSALFAISVFIVYYSTFINLLLKQKKKKNNNNNNDNNKISYKVKDY